MRAKLKFAGFIAIVLLLAFGRWIDTTGNQRLGDIFMTAVSVIFIAFLVVLTFLGLLGFYLSEKEAMEERNIKAYASAKSRK